MQMATSSIEFSFNDTFYQQTDGVAIRSPLSPALANIFVGYQETKLFLNMKKPLIYCHHIDDTFAVFENEDNCEKFLSLLNLFILRYISRLKKNLTLFFCFLMS